MKTKTKKYIPKTDSDYQNDRYMFSTTHTDLLSAIVKGQINPVQLAKKELEARGLNEDGRWVGFDKKIALKGR